MPHAAPTVASRGAWQRHHRAHLALVMLIALLLGHACVRASEPLSFPTLTTTRGVTYKDVKVTRFDALELRFTHAAGAATVPLSELQPELRELFGYDPKNESLLLKERQRQRTQDIITQADQKAQAAALREKEEADAQELQRIRSAPLRCYIRSVRRSEDALLVDVLPTDKLPVRLTSRRGKYERYKLTPQGKPELVEQPVPDQTFTLGPTLRLLPASLPVSADTIVTVYLIATGIGPEPLCALSPEGALEYRKKIEAARKSEPPATPQTTPPPSAPPPAPGQP
ncbi:hypothetical protein [Prosthecobacter fluviatilis]|uniref:DUF4412 domain-containing protein n=1 Tax=Prosthecobacter fluviatilis TaxID=445931 RepID=A0ABW0KV27_9BACT